MGQKNSVSQESRSVHEDNSVSQESRNVHENNSISQESGSMREDNIKIVVGVDFGTTFSGFAYAHVTENSNIVTFTNWPTEVGNGRATGLCKCNTILRYDPETSEVVSWGRPAVARPSRKRSSCKTLVAELFKLHLTDGIYEKPELPRGMSYEKPIVDFLKEMQKIIREEITKRWTPELTRYPEDVRFVFPVPAEFDQKKCGIMRTLIHAAGFTKTRDSENLQFTTEPEAAALYCSYLDQQYDLAFHKFLVVDCGGGTVDLTVRSFKKLGELVEHTERSGAPCGGSFIDKEFIRFLGTRLTTSAMEQFKQEYYQSYQYLCDHFSYYLKHTFTGNSSDFRVFELDIEDVCPVLMSCISDDSIRRGLEENEWIIWIGFEDVKAMFDPVISEILELVRAQLDQTKGGGVQTLFLVGGFAESVYLQTRIKNEFGSRVRDIVCPVRPVTAVLQGAVRYGIRKNNITSRVLKWTYGVRTCVKWKDGRPPERKKRIGNEDYIIVFDRYVKRGDTFQIHQKFEGIYSPITPNQKQVSFKIYYTKADDAEYCDEDGMQKLGTVTIDVPEFYGTNKPVHFTLTFGEMEIKARALCLTEKREVDALFKLDL